MKKAIVIGCPGSGKSTFSRELNRITNIPLFYLDMIFHRKDRTTVSKEEFDAKLLEIMQNEQWILDGNYLRTMKTRIDRCDTVFWLDYPTEICINGIKERFGKPRPDMPWIEIEEDKEFTEFIKNFKIESKPKIEKALSEVSGKRIYIFKSREEAKLYLKNLETHC